MHSKYIFQLQKRRSEQPQRRLLSEGPPLTRSSKSPLKSFLEGVLYEVFDGWFFMTFLTAVLLREIKASRIQFVLYCIVLYRILLYRIVTYCTVLYRIVPYCTALYRIVRYCIVLYRIEPYCTVSYCIVPYCTIL